jgi:hypothetical protein
MLYSFIPPAIVVISLIGIIIFLTKKAPQVALLENRNRDENNPETAVIRKGIFKKIFRSGDSKGQSFKHGFLVFLEKFTRKLRVFFLKLENLFTHWSENIKRKRKIHAESEENKVPNEEREAMEASGYSDDINQEPTLEKRNYGSRNDIYVRNSLDASRRYALMDPEEKPVRPIISEKVVVPRTKPEIKNRLERILIERIASNPKDTEAYERLGEYYFEIENYNHSKECFKQVIKLSPTNEMAKEKMKRLERLLVRRR